VARPGPASGEVVDRVHRFGSYTGAIAVDQDLRLTVDKSRRHTPANWSSGDPALGLRDRARKPSRMNRSGIGLLQALLDHVDPQRVWQLTRSM